MPPTHYDMCILFWLIPLTFQYLRFDPFYVLLKIPYRFQFPLHHIFHSVKRFNKVFKTSFL